MNTMNKEQAIDTFTKTHKVFPPSAKIVVLVGFFEEDNSEVVKAQDRVSEAWRRAGIENQPNRFAHDKGLAVIEFFTRDDIDREFAEQIIVNEIDNGYEWIAYDPTS